MKTIDTIAPGARVLIRDAEWLVRKVDRVSYGRALTVVGITELVKDKEAIFLDKIEKDIEVLDPADTKLIPDTSGAYQKSLLYMESLLRQTPPTDDNLYIGHRAAMDPVPYQLDPAIQALKQPRQRILIADAVGLGKTLASGILVSELIRRGRGKRILVLAVKSMMTQFQKEMWSRFTIPLVRLDSIGIQRVRSRIPTNHNPFYYYDKAIISIDTLKQDSEYRTYLENAYWDIIVIDEAHNVAERGKGSSLRAKLAKLLASRSDTLIMLSATPHDGKAKSFASLMNMLDPTAIADPENYGPEDIKGLFIRRFKKDIQDQVKNAFKKRKISKAYCQAGFEEELALDTFSGTKFARLDQRRGARQLFKTTLEKGLFSSPAACLSSIKKRIATLEKEKDQETVHDIEVLEELVKALETVSPDVFSKYQKLLSVIQDKTHGFGWTGKDTKDRLVIFTERIETLKFLHTNLLKDLGLKHDQVEILHGGMPDTDQQRIVEDFGKESAKVRLLIASDVASEGINLHYLSHRLVHFDIPWSLMVFQQRNGRIDRYGQDKTPHIIYLVSQSTNGKIKGDVRILELLIEKDNEAVNNIGDPSALMGVYDIDEEEKITAHAIETGQSETDFAALLTRKTKEAFDPVSLLMGVGSCSDERESKEKTRNMPSLYKNDYDYLKAAIGYLDAQSSIQTDFVDERHQVTLTANKELKHRLKFVLPREVWPDKDMFVLCADPDRIQDEIKISRKDETAWPKVHYLWPHNPVLEWINDKVIAGFGRQEAPVITLAGALVPEETIFIISGLIPNRKSHPLVHRWFGVVFSGTQFIRIEEFDALLARTGLGKAVFPNSQKDGGMEGLKRLLPLAVDHARQHMVEERNQFEEKINVKLNDHLKALEQLKEKKYRQLDLSFGDEKKLSQKDQARREIDRIFKDFTEWVEDTMTTEKNPYLQVVSVLRGGE